MNSAKGKWMGGRGEVGVTSGLEQIFCFPPNKIAGLVRQKNCLNKPLGWLSLYIMAGRSVNGLRYLSEVQQIMAPLESRIMLIENTFIIWWRKLELI